MAATTSWQKKAEVNEVDFANQERLWKFKNGMDTILPYIASTPKMTRQKLEKHGILTERERVVQLTSLY